MPRHDENTGANNRGAFRSAAGLRSMPDRRDASAWPAPRLWNRLATKWSFWPPVDVSKEIASANRLNQSQRGEAPIKLSGERSDARPVIVAGWRVSIVEIAPALVRPARRGHYDLKVRRTDTVDSPVLAILEAENVQASDQAVLDDPIEVAADDLIGSLRPHARGDSNLAVDRPPGDPILERFQVPARERNLRQMETRHASELAPRSPIRNGLAAEADQRRKAQERQESQAIGAGRNEYGRRHRRVDPQPIERNRHHDPREPSDEIVDHHGGAHDRAEQRVVKDQGDPDADEDPERYAVGECDHELAAEGANRVR